MTERNKQSFEVKDELYDILSDAGDEVRGCMHEWLDENIESGADFDDIECPDMGDDLNYSGRVDEIADSCTPVYNYDIKCVMFCHGEDIEEEFENQFGSEAKKNDDLPCGWKAAAICTFINQKIREQYEEEKEEWLEEWKSPENTTKFSDEEVDSCVNAYLDAALWSSVDDNDLPLDDNRDRDNVVDESKKVARRLIIKFLVDNYDDIQIANEEERDISDCGHDLWLTQHGHGTGFWDRGMGEVGERLTAYAKGIGEMEIYVCDDDNEKVFIYSILNQYVKAKPI